MHEQRIVENREETRDAHTLIIEKPKDFDFSPGQYVLLQTTVDARPLRRSYTIASAPHQEHIHITIRTQPQGRVSPTLAQLKKDDTIGVLGPVGDFMRGDEDHSVFVAAGAGITPFISMLRSDAHNNKQRKTTILYTNKTLAQELYSQELREHAKKPHVHLYQTLTREEDPAREHGRISEKQLLEYLDTNSVFYLCGSNTMVRSLTKKLLEIGARADQIRTENYGNVYS